MAADKNMGGDHIIGNVSNVSSGQVAVGKGIYQTRSHASRSVPFRTEEFLQQLRQLKQLLTTIDLNEDLKEDLEDNLSAMRQEVKQARETERKPDKAKIDHYLQKTEGLLERLGKLGDIGTKLLPALQALAKLAGLP